MFLSELEKDEKRQNEGEPSCTVHFDKEPQQWKFVPMLISFIQTLQSQPAHCLQVAVFKVSFLGISVGVTLIRQVIMVY